MAEDGFVKALKRRRQISITFTGALPAVQSPYPSGSSPTITRYGSCQYAAPTPSGIETVRGGFTDVHNRSGGRQGRAKPIRSKTGW